MKPGPPDACNFASFSRIGKIASAGLTTTSQYQPDKEKNNDQSRTAKPDRSRSQREPRYPRRVEGSAGGRLRPLPQDEELPLAHVGQPFSRLSSSAERTVRPDL